MMRPPPASQARDFAMQVDLSGLRTLVTGSTKGIGRAIAEALPIASVAL
jgi:hypothetical protein